jgi:hypothetical protein
MTNVPSQNVFNESFVAETNFKSGSEFGIGYTIAMKNGIVEISTI